MNEPAPHPSADLDRRAHAFVVDRLVGAGVLVVAAAIAWMFFWSHDQIWAGVGLVVAVGVLTWCAFATLEGATGRTPGKALTGLRTVRQDSDVPPGVGRGWARALVRALAGLPTVGLGWATLGWTAAADPSGRRRGWHDRVSGCEVVDVRPAPVVVAPAPEAPRHVVNLTAMRLSAPSTDATGEAPIPRPARSDDSGIHRRPAAAPGAATRESPAEPTPPVELPTWILRFDTGQEVTLRGVALIGRSPTPRPGEQVAHLLPLPSQDMSVSKTHAQIHVASDGALVVIDRGSTNGSILQRKGLARELSAGRATTLLDGDLVRLGDREISVRRG